MSDEVAVAAVQSIDPKAAAVWMSIDELEKWPKNPRKYDPEEAALSLVRFGFCAACTAWTSRRMLVAGHARTAGLRLLLDSDPTLSQPEHQKLRASLTGPTLRHVPVRFREFESEEEAEAYALRDNRDIGAWLDDQVGDIMRDLETKGQDLEGLGGTDEQVDVLTSGETDVRSYDEEDLAENCSRTSGRTGKEVFSVGHFVAGIEVDLAEECVEKLEALGDDRSATATRALRVVLKWIEDGAP